MGALTKAGVNLDQYRESHHSIARLVAIGATPELIRRQTGVTFRRLSLHLGDPSFTELVEHYRKRVDEKWNENVDQFLDIGMGNMIRSEAMIQDRLDKADEDGEELPLLTLNRLSQDRADRFGYPKTSQVEHKHDFAALLDRAIERSGKAKDVKVIEATAVEVSSAQNLSPSTPLLLSEPRVVTPTSLPSARPSIAAVLTMKRRRVA